CNMLTRATAKKASTSLESHNIVTHLVVSKTTPSTEQVEEILTEQLEDTSDEEEVTWVQCDREECLKWRKLPYASQISTTEDWYCDMHPDPAQRSCDIPEEKCKISGKKFFTYTWFPAGQLVWAKMTGYPQWPAVVTPDPWSHGDHFSIETDAEGCIYHIEFLGKPRSHVWMSERQIVPFHRHQLPESKLTKRLALAIKEAEAFSDLTDQERVERCEFITKTICCADKLDTKLKEGSARSHRKKSLYGRSSQEAMPQKHTQEKKPTKTEKVVSKASLQQQLCTPLLTAGTIQSVTSPCMVPRPNPSVGCCSTQSHTDDSLKDLTSFQCTQDELQTKFYAKPPHSNDNFCKISDAKEGPAHDQIVPSITDQDAFSHLESSILNEWKEIENLCTITDSASTMECDLSSVLSEMQNIEDFIQVINEDSIIFPT
ncbi:hypothetical protein EMCRGX_G014158, partial [Ephydatia muelleri]